MATTTVTRDNFEETVSSNEIVLVDFWAPWCGPCRQFGPVFEKVSEANPDIVFAKVNTEEQPELAGEFSIMSIPTLMAFRNGIILYSQPGALPQGSLEELVQKVREVDMQEVEQAMANAKD